MYDGTNFRHVLFLERQYISCIFLAAIRQDLRHIWQIIMRFEVFRISFDATFLCVTQFNCELFRSLSVNLINRSFNARSIFIFCQLTD